MNVITRWDPFKDADLLHNRLAKVLGLASPYFANGGSEMMKLAEWAPAVDISEDGKEWLVKADLPEVQKEDVKVSVENGVLTVTGERKGEKEEKGRKFHRIERSYGAFQRSFVLPNEADSAKVAAEFKDGVLSIHLPKNEQAKPKSLDVKIA